MENISSINIVFRFFHFSLTKNLHYIYLPNYSNNNDSSSINNYISIYRHNNNINYTKKIFIRVINWRTLYNILYTIYLSPMTTINNNYYMKLIYFNISILLFYFFLFHLYIYIYIFFVFLFCCVWNVWSYRWWRWAFFLSVTNKIFEIV